MTHRVNLTNKRSSERKNIQVLVQFNFHGSGKLFESTTRDISLAGIFINTDEGIINLIDIGSSIVVMLEYKHDFFVKVKGYIVRIQTGPKSYGFAMKYLDLSPEQKQIIDSLTDI